MADKKIGGVYVGVSLDGSHLVKDFENIDKSCKNSAKAIEAEFMKAKPLMDTKTIEGQIKIIESKAQSLRQVFNTLIAQGVKSESLEGMHSQIKKLEDDADVLKGKYKDLQSPAKGNSFLSGLGEEATGLVSKFNVALVSVFSLAKGFDYLKSAVEASEARTKAMAGVDALLKSTGRSAEMTSSEVLKIANNLREVNKNSVKTNDIIDAEGIVLTFENIKKADIPKTTQTVIDLAARMGTDLKSAALSVGIALEAPDQGFRRLRQAGILFTDDEKKTIKSMVDSGDAAGAQAVMFDKLSEKVGGYAASVVTPLEAVENKFDVITGTIKRQIGDMITSALEPFAAEATKDISPINSEFEEAQKKSVVLKTRFEELATTTEGLGNKTNRTANEQKLYKDTINTLLSEYPNYFKNLDANKTKYEDIKNAIVSARVELDNYMQSMVKAAIYQDKQNQIVDLGKKQYEALKTKYSTYAEYNKRSADGTIDDIIPGQSPRKMLGGDHFLTFREQLNNNLKSADATIDETSNKIKGITTEITKMGDVISGGVSETKHVKTLKELNNDLKEAQANLKKLQAQNADVPTLQKASQEVKDLKKQLEDVGVNTNKTGENKTHKDARELFASKLAAETAKIPNDNSRKKQSIEDKLTVSKKFDTKTEQLKAQQDYNKESADLERENNTQLAEAFIKRINLMTEQNEAEGMLDSEALGLKADYLQSLLKNFDSQSDAYKRLKDEITKTEIDITKSTKKENDERVKNEKDAANEVIKTNKETLQQQISDHALSIEEYRAYLSDQLAEDVAGIEANNKKTEELNRKNNTNNPLVDVGKYIYSRQKDNNAKTDDYAQGKKEKDMKDYKKEHQFLTGTAEAAGQELENAWNGTFNNMFEHGLNFTKRMGEVWKDMASNLISDMAMIGAKWLELQALQLLPGGGFLNFLIKGLGGDPTAHEGGTFAGTPNGVMKMSGGGSFIVPPGYDNDKFPLWVESGELVNVTPKSAMNFSPPQVPFNFNNATYTVPKRVMDVLGNGSGGLNMKEITGRLDALNANLFMALNRTQTPTATKLESTIKGNDIYVTNQKAAQIARRYTGA